MPRDSVCLNNREREGRLASLELEREFPVYGVECSPSLQGSQRTRERRKNRFET